MTETLFEDGGPKRRRKVDNTSPEALLYLAYPIHRARGAALKMIRKALKTVPFDTLMAAVKRYGDSDEVQGYIASGNHQFIKRCATWFNDECWADEIPESPYQKRLKKEREARVAEGLKVQSYIKRVAAMDEATLNGFRGRLGGDFLRLPKGDAYFCERICELQDQDSDE